MAQGMSGFETNVFINCPFDRAYKPLLRALLFVVIDCGFEPRIASESTDSGAVRVEKIKNLIKASQYSIHDLSRIEALNPGELPRFNMPFELGLDLGCRDFGAAELTTKKCLIFEKDQYRYQHVLSDISGNDIQAHHADPETLVRHVRNWFYGHGSQPRSGATIWRRFNEFYGNFGRATGDLGYDEDDLVAMPDTEFIDFIKRWKQGHPMR